MKLGVANAAACQGLAEHRAQVARAIASYRHRRGLARYADEVTIMGDSVDESVKAVLAMISPRGQS